MASIWLLAFYFLFSFARAVDHPNITLPWGTWQAQVLEDDKNIYIFRNVRFGANPIRFGMSSYPNPIANNLTLQDSSYGPSCIQVNTSLIPKAPALPGGRLGKQPKVDPINQSEDCLFHDIYVPVHYFDKFGKLLPSTSLPVTVWIYGGAYMFGTKDYGGDSPLYTGQAMLKASGYKQIFISGNYRLGAFGWLAGAYMESAGVPNAGLYDQALLLQWVKDWVSLVGGNPSRVSAWGESAGAGSILHHLVREGGTKDPLFQTFLVQSPAYEWGWDNSTGGTLDQVFQNFSQLATCGKKFDIDCLRSQTPATLIKANQDLFNYTRQTGLFPVGPSIDGRWIKTLPAVSFSSGTGFWPGIKNGLISHVADEAGGFTPKYVVSQATFDQYLNAFMPESQLQPERDLIRAQYNCNTTYKGNFNLCLTHMIQDSTFTCNTRWLYKAVPNNAHMMQYTFPGPFSFFNAPHASDLVPAFMNDQADCQNILTNLVNLNQTEAVAVCTIYPFIRERYQAYLAGFGLSGDPNSIRGFDWVDWPIVNATGDSFSSVMDVRRLNGDLRYFSLITDTMNMASTCKFWEGIATSITKRVGKGRSFVREEL